MQFSVEMDDFMSISRGWLEKIFLPADREEASLRVSHTTSPLHLFALAEILV
jgi:hypothetical protein